MATRPHITDDYLNKFLQELRQLRVHLVRGGPRTPQGEISENGEILNGETEHREK